MIPNVLQALIDRYNEKGMFFALINKIIWFNGKRLELWINENIKALEMIRIIGDKIIGSDHYSLYEIQYKSIKMITKNYSDFNRFYNRHCIFNGFEYHIKYGDLCKGDRFDFKTILYNQYRRLFIYEHVIYCFGYYDLKKIDKYDQVTTCKDPPRAINIIHLFGNKFYCCDDNFYYYIYEPDEDIWSDQLYFLG